MLGDDYVKQATANTTDFDRLFQEFISETAWGTVWADPTITQRERSMLTLALLAATKNFAEIPMHIRATRNTGASENDIIQAFLHVAIYAGIPAANRAIQIAKQTFAEMENPTP